MADRRSDSGTESVLRVMLTQADLEFRIQERVPFTDLNRMDFVVGDRLVIECDREAHHGTAANRRRDLRRDAALASPAAIGMSSRMSARGGR